MSTRNTVIRSMHDVGLAAWFGGALMGAVGLNGAANEVDDPTDRAKVASAGWARWAPVNAAAIGAHLIGGIGLILTNRQRLAVQGGARTNTIVKTALTGVAIASTAFSGWKGTQVFAAGKVHAEGGTTPSDRTPAEPAAAMRRLRVAQWVTPAVAAVLIVLGAQQGEQQRPGRLCPRSTADPAAGIDHGSTHRRGPTTVQPRRPGSRVSPRAPRGPGHGQHDQRKRRSPMSHPLTTPGGNDRNPNGHSIFDPAPTRVNHVPQATDTTRTPSRIGPVRQHRRPDNTADPTEPPARPVYVPPASAPDRATVVARQRERFGGIKAGSAFFGWLTATGMSVLLIALLAAAGVVVRGGHQHHGDGGPGRAGIAEQAPAPRRPWAWSVRSPCWWCCWSPITAAGTSPAGWPGSTASNRASRCGCGAW